MKTEWEPRTISMHVFLFGSRTEYESLVTNISKISRIDWKVHP